ncbi:aminotransferase class V-fold PLP-dependent enzyme [Kushneria phosphatilytica]|uniref:Aminotransferase class V-fold PLP-dependent enzyme n=1 Tax=Kushneria phosphatilytica TaxID=657387 RepID=A0A5C0ZVL8_9GAMM|nr:aminotransferase class V-fold PLP-dependent enzyme [Kushneria phosphatilytica]QEL10201.1 aminotransferase class V-fold PLP-dependent enzyme [Kushneria phosphatilytica]
MLTLQTFRASLERADIVEYLRAGLIGDEIGIDTPFGRRRLLYADYVASGRALRQVEQFISEQVLPFYANSHTEASFCGQAMTRLRQEAREIIREQVNGAGCHVVFNGAGATAGINRLIGLLDIADRVRCGQRITVLIGPYEHHSNLLPWRESGAELIEIPEATGGGPDLGILDRTLTAKIDSDLLIGSFSAASNVTGTLTDVDTVTRCLKRHGALAIWDYAGGAPYLPMDMAPTRESEKDAIVFSPHKFIGGPGASGVLVFRDSVVHTSAPTLPGGGTVRFVSPWQHHYSERVEAREEGGTPNVIGDIRAALVLLVKDAIGTDVILERDTELRHRALAYWSGIVNLHLLGNLDAPALPIFSFQVVDHDGLPIHHQLFTRMLSDVHGIQARGGCACAGPYAHRLMEIDDVASSALMTRLENGDELAKPGWVRLNLSYLHSDDQVERILAGVAELSRHANEWAQHYEVEPSTARFHASVDCTQQTAPEHAIRPRSQ